MVGFKNHRKLCFINLLPSVRSKYITLLSPLIFFPSYYIKPRLSTKKIQNCNPKTFSLVPWDQLAFGCYKRTDTCLMLSCITPSNFAAIGALYDLHFRDGVTWLSWWFFFSLRLRIFSHVSRAFEIPFVTKMHRRDRQTVPDTEILGPISSHPNQPQ